LFEYQRALELTPIEVERRFLEGRVAEMWQRVAEE
jgi:predicted RNA polymerase sigma factor